MWRRDYFAPPRCRGGGAINPRPNKWRIFDEAATGSSHYSETTRIAPRNVRYKRGQRVKLTSIYDAAVSFVFGDLKRGRP